jgi:hypothetical protein
MPSLLLVKGEGCRDSLLQRMSPFMAESGGSLRRSECPFWG